VIQSTGRSRFRARVLHRLGATLALVTVLVATLIPATVVAADPSPAPERSGPATVIPRRDPPHQGPDRGILVNPVPVGSVGIRSSTGYFYGDGSIAVVGEVLNLTSTRRRSVAVRATYYNASNVVVGTFTREVLLDRVSRSAVGPFLLYDQGPPGPGCDATKLPAGCIASFSVRTISSVQITTAPAGSLQILGSSSSVDGDVRRFEGTVRNPNGFRVINVVAMVTAYDAEGNVLDVTFDPIDGLAAGASAPFIMEIAVSGDPALLYHHALIQADAYRSGQSGSYVTSWGNYFDDIATAPFRSSIVWLAEQGITTGCGPGRYCPTASVRRSEMASFLARAMDLPPATRDYFSDDNGKTHEANINRLAEAGITGGCAPSRYCPNAFVRRDQMASFLARALKLPPATTDYFTDDRGNTHEANINRLRAAGITSGCGGGTKYCPAANVTRAQMAAFLRRAFE
jgi:hypothetical protein